jgi:hypothetical protein
VLKARDARLFLPPGVCTKCDVVAEGKDHIIREATILGQDVSEIITPWCAPGNWSGKGGSESRSWAKPSRQAAAEAAGGARGRSSARQAVRDAPQAHRRNATARDHPRQRFETAHLTVDSRGYTLARLLGLEPVG